MPSRRRRLRRRGESIVSQLDTLDLFLIESGLVPWGCTRRFGVEDDEFAAVIWPRIRGELKRLYPAVERWGFDEPDEFPCVPPSRPVVQRGPLRLAGGTEV